MSNFSNITEDEYFKLVNLRNQLSLMQSLLGGQHHTTPTFLNEEMESFFSLQFELLSQVTDVLNSRAETAPVRMQPRNWMALITALRNRSIDPFEAESITARLDAEAKLDSNMAPVMNAWHEALQTAPSEVKSAGAQTMSSSTRKRSKLVSAHA